MRPKSSVRRSQVGICKDFVSGIGVLNLKSHQRFDSQGLLPGREAVIWWWGVHIDELCIRKIPCETSFLIFHLRQRRSEVMAQPNQSLCSDLWFDKLNIFHNFALHQCIQILIFLCYLISSKANSVVTGSWFEPLRLFRLLAPKYETWPKFRSHLENFI